MTAGPPAEPVEAPPGRRNGGGIVAVVCALVALLAAVVVLFAGGALLWTDYSTRTPDGYLLSHEETVLTRGFAVTSDRVRLSTGAGWLPASALGTARVEVTGTTPDAKLFVGVAPAAKGAGYLGGVQRTVVSDLGSDRGATGQTLVPGDAPSGAPGDRDFWVAKASGPGPQQLTWVPARGDWTLVVMNADGSAGVSVTATVGATVPALDTFARWILLGGGLLALVGVLLLVLAVRRRRRRAGSPEQAAVAMPVGPAADAG
jgi:hypothetical protein